MLLVLSDPKSMRRKCIPSILCVIALPMLLALGRVTAAGTATDPRFSQLLQQGKEAEEAGNLDDAIARYQEALKINPASPLPQTKLAAIYYKRKDFEKTLAYCDRVLAVNPKDATAAGMAGVAAYQLNRYQPAVKYLQTALAVQSHDSQLHYWLGMTLYAVLDPRHALDEFYRARIFNPKDTEVLYMIGKIHWEMCRQAWEEMVRVDPDSVRVKQMVAEQDEIKNLYAEAIAKYQEIIQQQPNAPGFHYALGKLYLHIVKLSEAEDAFQAELKLDPHSPLGSYGLAEVAFERQDLPTALDNANRAIAAKPDFGDAYVLRGRIEMGMGDTQKAMTTLEHAATLSPSDASLYYVLGHVYTDLGKRDLAAKAYATYQQLKGQQEKEIQVAR
jgi:tetratricopeptide (TPR) repeat protein